MLIFDPQQIGLSRSLQLFLYPLKAPRSLFFCLHIVLLHAKHTTPNQLRPSHDTKKL
eukprot:gene5293-3796_t